MDFAVKKPKDVKTIMIPPREVNPFYEVTKKKQKNLLKTIKGS